MHHRTIDGKIRYTSRKPGMEGKERGRESFRYTVHTDGKRTMRAHCEIEEPDPTVMRDIVYSLDENDRPMDCFVRLTVGDKFMGAGLVIFSGDQIEMQSYGPSIGRVSQKLDDVGRFDGFGTHPIQADAYLTKQLDLSNGPYIHQLRCFVPSADHRGATAPVLAEVCMQLEYVGDEEATCPAGTFQCRHFRFMDEHGGMATDKGAHPTYDMWVTADDDAIFVKGGVGGYMQTWYELVELNR